MKPWQMGWNTAAIWTTAPLHYLLITVEGITLERVAFGDIQNPETVCEHIDSLWQALSA